MTLCCLLHRTICTQSCTELTNLVHLTYIGECQLPCFRCCQEMKAPLRHLNARCPCHLIGICYACLNTNTHPDVVRSICHCTLHCADIPANSVCMQVYCRAMIAPSKRRPSSRRQGMGNCALITLHADVFVSRHDSLSVPNISDD